MTPKREPGRHASPFKHRVHGAPPRVTSGVTGSTMQETQHMLMLGNYIAQWDACVHGQARGGGARTVGFCTACSNSNRGSSSMDF
jgi:hypothetical protein